MWKNVFPNVFVQVVSAAEMKMCRNEKYFAHTCVSKYDCECVMYYVWTAFSFDIKCFAVDRSSHHVKSN